MTLLICGTRTFADYDLLCRKCDALTVNYSAVYVVTGAPDEKDRKRDWVPGADGLAERWAKERGHKYRNFAANWKRYGNPAGPLRNRDMAIHLLTCKGARGVVAFWDEISRGTKDMIDVAEAAGIPVRIVRI
jgi:hypothetical protein